MNVCAKCGASATALTRTRLATYNHTVLDMPVVLMNVVDRFSCKCGHAVEVIPNHEGLIAAVALCRIMQPVKLNGNEIRLLRKTLGLKAIELAKRLDVSPETLSRWENDAEVIGNSSERSFRIRIAISLTPKAPAISLDMESLMTMEIMPIRPVNWSPLWLEGVRVKDDEKKETQYDKAA